MAQRVASNTIGTIADRNSATMISCARTATKNVLYTYCNTVYLQSLYIKSMEDDNAKNSLPLAEIVGKESSLPAPL